MKENPFIGLPLPIAAGFLFFRKKTYADSCYKSVAEETPRPDDGQTGVARYIQKQRALMDEKGGVRPASTGVNKYIENQKQNRVTGVAKYILRVRLAEKQATRNKTVETNVSRYLKKQAVLPKATGVAKYIKRHESDPKPTKVARYLTNMTLADKQAVVRHVGTTGTTVANYLKQKEQSPKMSSVSKYMLKQKQSVSIKQPTQTDTKPAPLTGVEKYMRLQEAKAG